MRSLILVALAATAALLLLAIVAAVAQPLDPPSDRDHESYRERSWPEPHYWSSWERTQRGYLPSYQFDLERRKVCGNLCDDLTRERRDPFDDER